MGKRVKRSDSAVSKESKIVKSGESGLEMPSAHRPETKKVGKLRVRFDPSPVKRIDWVPVEGRGHLHLAMLRGIGIGFVDFFPSHRNPEKRWSGELLSRRINCAGDERGIPENLLNGAQRLLARVVKAAHKQVTPDTSK